MSLSMGALGFRWLNSYETEGPPDSIQTGLTAVRKNRPFRSW